MNFKKIMTLGLLFLSFGLFAQDFPGKDVELLVGKKIKVLPRAESLQQYGYDGFFINSNLKRKYACCQSYNSKYKDLENKIFEVLSFEPYKDRLGANKFKLQINNEETGIIYFDYSPEYEHLFPFEVIGGLEIPEGFLCKNIEEIKEKFSDKVTYQSPLLEPIVFIKAKDKEIVKTFMRISIYGNTVNVGKKGAIILLENGEKINKPDVNIDVEVDNYGKGYNYSTFISLSMDEIEILKNIAITDVRLYVYDFSIKNGEIMKEYLRCISEK